MKIAGSPRKAFELKGEIKVVMLYLEMLHRDRQPRFACEEGEEKLWDLLRSFSVETHGSEPNEAEWKVVEKAYRDRFEMWRNEGRTIRPEDDEDERDDDE